MKLDELLANKKIHRQEYDCYMLFAMDDRGQRYLKDLIEQLLMDKLSPEIFTGEYLGYFEGRRSVVRDIKEVIDKVNYLLRGE